MRSRSAGGTLRSLTVWVICAPVAEKSKPGGIRTAVQIRVAAPTPRLHWSAMATTPVPAYHRSLAALAACALPAIVGCHATPLATYPPAAGVVIRLHTTAPGARRREGTVLSTARDSLRLAARGTPGTRDTLTIAVQDVTRLEVVQGRRGFAGRGALIGAGVGALTLTVVAIAAVGEQSCSTATLRDGTQITTSCKTYQASDIAAAPLIGGALGLPIGALVGAFVRGDRWTPVVLPTAGGRARPGAPGLGHGALRVGVSLAFGAP
jgi:hypothetical protein